MSIRNQPLTIRFTPEEYESLKQQSKLNNSKNLAEFVRDKLFMSSDFQGFQINQDIKAIKESLSTNLYAINTNLKTIKYDQDTRDKKYLGEFFVLRGLLKKIGISFYKFLELIGIYIFYKTSNKNNEGFKDLNTAARKTVETNPDPKENMLTAIDDLESEYNER